MRVWPFWRRKRRDADLDDEIAFDLAAEAKARVDLGATAAEAEQASRRDFGNVTLLKEDVRETWGWTWLEHLAQDLRYGCRSLRGSPLFTATAVLSLALGIGANTAIYSVMDAVLFRALPVENPGQLVIPNWRAAKPDPSHYTQPVGIRIVDGSVYNGPNDERISPNFSWPFYELIRDHNDVFSSVFAHKDGGQLNLLIQGNAELGRVEFVSGNFFRSLGIQTAAGRLIDDRDDRPGAPAVAVLSYAYWRNRFAENPAVIGQTIHIGDLPVTIEGVAAPEFFGVDPASVPMLYVPIVNRPQLAKNTIGPDEHVGMFTDSGYYWTDMIGRLRPGVTMAQADAEVSARFQQFVTDAGGNAERRAFPALHLLEGGSGIDSLRRKYSKPLFVLLTLAALILIIACANIANLLLARAAARSREIAVRLNIGASRTRVVRQLLTESVMLAMLGGIAGLGVAAVGIRLLVWLLAGGSGEYPPTGLDLRVLSFTVAVTLITGIIFGLVPALQATRFDLAPALRAVRVGATRGNARRSGLSQILVAAQIGLSLVLVLSAVLFVRTLTNLHSVELGFNAENILTFNLNGSKAGYEGAGLTAFYARIEGRLNQLPGVSAATVTNAPLAERAFRTPYIFSVDRKGGGGWCSVGPTFFETMQIPILRGRAIDSRDVAGAPYAVVVNETFAETYFPNQDPLGQRVEILNDGTEVTIVGIAKDFRQTLKEEILPYAYIAYRQNIGVAAWRGMTFEVRTAGDALALAEVVRVALRQEAPNVPMADIKTQSRRIDDTIVQERTFANLCTAFAILALVIACVGLYGTIAYSVAQRTNEIGVRMALGARQPQIVRMVLSEVLILAVGGLAVGFFAAWNSMHAVESFLFGVTPADPSSILWATAILTAALLFAAYVPARRASRIEPSVALRHE